MDASRTYIHTKIDGQTFTSNGTLTIPAGVTSIFVEGIGGGGGGGGSGGRDNCGGGGSGVVSKAIISVTPGEQYSVVIGSGGGQLTNGSATTLTRVSGSVLVFSAAGGIAGDERIAGRGGNVGGTPFFVGTDHYGGPGGGGWDGMGGAGGHNAAGSNGTGYGSGGGGGTSGNAGGSGTDGKLIVRWNEIA